MKGLIYWFTENSVAANILMVLILVAGFMSLTSMQQEIFPELTTDLITVSVPYPGATPAEVEESIAIKVEEQIQDIDGIKKVTSTSVEGAGTVSIEIERGADVRRVLDDVKSRVDAIITFPEQAEKPVIQEVLVRRGVIQIAISGDTDERSLRRIGERVRDELTQKPGITQVSLGSVRPYEISIEVSEESLRRHALTFDEVVRAVRASSQDLPGGSIKAQGGEILLRSMGQAYEGDEFAAIVLRTRPDGTRLLLGEVAAVVDGFQDIDKTTRFDGEPAVLVQVFRVGEQDALEVAATVTDYIASGASWFPDGISLTAWDDNSVYLKSRRDLLLRNGATGLGLVFLVLTMFLRFRLAIWVSVGIPISFLGAIWMMPLLGVTINLITLFAFILVLGIVVDDAIVVGENIYTHYRRHGDAFKAAVEGTQEVAVPVTFGVLTTVVAFMPLIFIPGTMGKVWKSIPLIVIPVLLFSLVESKTILPAHLKHLPPRKRNNGQPGFQERFALGLESFIRHKYEPLLDLALRYRYVTIAQGIALLLVTFAIVAGGWLKFTFMPPVEADTVIATLEMPLGTPVASTSEAIGRLESAADQLRREIDESTDTETSVFRHVLAAIGEHPSMMEARGPQGPPSGNFNGSHLGEVQIELVGSEFRSISSAEISRRWRELTGAIPGVSKLTFESSLFRSGDAINIQLSATEIEELEAVAARIKPALANYAGVKDISDSYEAGKTELKLRITPEGQSLGLSQSDLGAQVRAAFYGAEAQRIQRGRDEVKVMVRFPQDERRSLVDLRNMRIRLPDGTSAPFHRVAEVERGRGFSSINRVDRQRIVSVTADVDIAEGNADEILREVTASILPPILADHPTVTWSLEGSQQEQRDTLGNLRVGLLTALLVIYGMMAIPFRSYIHPLIVMSAVPFGLVGAIWGHVIMGMSLSVLSFIGMVALTGVVVNDSLVLVDYVNRRRREGLSIHEAVRVAGPARFRAILLTSLTTFAGLTPMLLERSLQARFLIPLAISLAFGVLFATIVTLFMVPSLYLILEDVLALPRRLFRRGEVSRTGHTRTEGA
jgi:multidrug efflux pump subunit AcrB